MKFYKINTKYLEYLHRCDKEVYFDEKNVNYKDKPYIGVIVFKNKAKYFIPLSSAKNKHAKLKNVGKDYILIYERIKKEEIKKSDIIANNSNKDCKKILSIIDFKKMIPVIDGCYERIDIRKEKNRDLLSKEYQFCKRKELLINEKATRILEKQNKTNRVQFAYCNFNLLEEKSLQYNASNIKVEN